MPRSDRNSGGTGDRSAQSRRNDRSGLIDIRALSSLVDAQHRGGPSASASSVALPSFSTPWTVQPMPEPERRAATPARAVAASSSDRPLYVMLASLSLAVVSLGAYVVLRPAPQVVVEAAAAPTVDAEAVKAEVAKAEVVKAEPEPDPSELEGTLAVAASSEEEPAPAEREATPAESEAEPEAAARRSRATRPRASRERRSDRSATPEPESPKKPQGVSVECVLDPSACGRGGAALPKTPSAAQIRGAMAAVKPSAKACAGRHGGRAGDKVRVKLSVKGSTGAVVSARALDEHEGTALGRCVAEALAEASLPRFSKPQAGIVYAIRL